VTARERVLVSLEHRRPDKTPYHVDFTEPARARMAEFSGDPDFESRLGNCLVTLKSEPRGAWKEVLPGIWEDQFGVRWDRTIDRDIGNVCNRPITRENLDAYRFPDPDDPSRFENFARTLAAAPDRFRVSNLGFSLFERAWTLAGMETFLMAMASEKDYAHALLDRILDFNLRIIKKACAYPIDAMMFGDDWGQQRGLVMGPALWREFIKPRIALMYARVKSEGKRVFIHSCGKVDELFPELIECGLDAFNPFQPEVMDVREMKRRYGDRLSFFGGISTQKTLPYGTVGQVREEVRGLLDEVGRDGGYIAAPAHSIPRDAKPENIAAMLEVLQAQ